MSIKSIMAKELWDVLSQLNVHRKFFLLRFCQKHGLNKNELKVLLALDTHQRTNLKTIASFLGMDEGNVSRRVDRLKNLKLIVREQDPHDKRCQQLTPTIIGRQIIYDFNAYLIDIVSDFFVNYKQRENLKFIKILTDFKFHLDDERMGVTHNKQSYRIKVSPKTSPSKKNRMKE